MEKLRKLSRYIRSAIILSLVLMLPGLASCQGRKAFSTFFSDITNTEQADLTNSKPVVSAASCSTGRIVKQPHLLPEHTNTFTHSAALLAADYFLYNLPDLSPSRIRVQDQFKPKDLYAPPLFLRNRAILI
jgi:hypothetical protein